MQQLPLHGRIRIHRSIQTLLIACSCVWGTYATESVASVNDNIVLASQCPPYFSLEEGNRCKLNTLYDLYPAANPRWGGYRVALPARRDGFTPQQIDLGRYLFFDSILSADRDLSCAHCHHPRFGLSDGRSRSNGRHGRGIGPSRTGGAELPRGAPGLWNLAFQQQFFWDGRAGTLEEQIETVLTTGDEMASSPEQLVKTLNGIPAYRRLFRQAFGVESIEFRHVTTAVVAFESSLVSLNSRYDQYVHGAQDVLNGQETNGLHIFRSFATRCSQCHTPPLFTSGQVTATGVPPIDGLPFDKGAEVISQEPSLRGAFKVPSLRNIASSAPYMHAGQAQTLSDAIEFYNDEPGHAVTERDDLTLHWHVVNPNLSSDEVIDLVAFLKTLSDETALPRIPDRVPSGLPVP